MVVVDLQDDRPDRAVCLKHAKLCSCEMQRHIGTPLVGSHVLVMSNFLNDELQGVELQG